MTYEYKSWRVLPRLRSEEAKTLLVMLEDMFNSATLQHARIEDHFQKDVHAGSPEFMWLYTDSHFYLVCWDDFRKILSKLSPMLTEDLGRNWIESFMNKYKETFDNYNRARNTLEHAEDRVFELGAEARSFYGWFDDRIYHIAGRKSERPLVIEQLSISVGVDSLRLLQQILDELLDVLDQNLPKRMG